MKRTATYVFFLTSFAFNCCIHPQQQTPQPTPNPASQRTITEPGMPGTATGKITGHVYRAGHPLGGATITLISPETNFTRQTTSDSRGRYTFKKLVASRYHVEASIQPGPKASKELTVQDGKTIVQDFHME